VTKLIYSAITSLDGYVADENGNFDWAAPSAEVHAAVNDQERTIGTYLYGRRMYEVMAVWETMNTDGEPDVMRDYADIWRAADKIVYSRTLDDVRTPRTRLQRDFDPDGVRALKEQGDISIGGPHLAAEAIRGGLVDELHLFVTPVVIGGGISALPDGVRWELELAAERRFGNGVVHLQYRSTNAR
jgi:dihydrofolate reductase